MRPIRFFYERLHSIWSRIRTSNLLLAVLIIATVLSFGTVVIFFIEVGRNKMFDSLFDALWWAVITATTVGYGDSIPLTVWGKAFTILFTLAGVAAFALYTATV